MARKISPFKSKKIRDMYEWKTARPKSVKKAKPEGYTKKELVEKLRKMYPITKKGLNQLGKSDLEKLYESRR